MVYEKDTLATPEAIAEIKSFIKWYDSQGCINFGAICREKIQLHVLEKLESTNLIIFKSLAEAEKTFLKT